MIHPTEPYTRTARFVDSERARVFEYQLGRVIRVYERDLRTFSEDQRNRICIAAVTNSEVRL